MLRRRQLPSSKPRGSSPQIVNTPAVSASIVEKRFTSATLSHIYSISKCGDLDRRRDYNFIGISRHSQMQPYPEGEDYALHPDALLVPRDSYQEPFRIRVDKDTTSGLSEAQ